MWGAVKTPRSQAAAWVCAQHIFVPGPRLKLAHDHCPKVGGVMAWLGVDCLKVGASGSGYIDHLATARVTVGASRCDPNATVAKCLDNCSVGA